MSNGGVVEVFWDVRLCRTAVLLKIEVFWDVRLSNGGVAED